MKIITLIYPSCARPFIPKGTHRSHASEQIYFVAVREGPFRDKGRGRERISFPIMLSYTEDAEFRKAKKVGLLSGS